MYDKNILVFLFISIFFCSNVVFSEGVPSYREIRDSYHPSDGTILDLHGRFLQTIRFNVRERKLAWTEEGEIPETLLLALFVQEDKRFFEHSGVDLLAILGAMKDRILGNSKRGASTLSMQLAGIFLGTKPGRRNIFDKWEQMRFAQKIEQTWSKNEILIGYLNLIQFRGEHKGLRAASRGLFQKEPSALSDAESVLLVAMLPFPGASPSVLVKRSCALAKKIQREELCYLFESVVDRMTTKMSALPAVGGIAFHAAQKIFRENPEFLSRDGKVKTTLDFDLQWKVTELAKNVMDGLKKQNVAETGILVLDNLSGAILVYVGNLPDSSSFYVDSIPSKRQAGSTLKPFLYGLAFEKEVLKPNSILEDTPAEWNAVSGIYRPSNYSDMYHGNVQAKYALASSLNIPAIHVLDLVSVSSFVQRLKDLGLSGLKRADFYGSSLALGSADVTLFELTNAYRTLANGGMGSKPTFFPYEAKQTLEENFREGNRWNRIYTKQAAETLGEILSNREYRFLSFGLNNHLSTRFFTAVKTGTSQDMRDNWCVGYSKNYTVGVWVGNLDGSPMWDVSGVTGAAPIWNAVIGLLQERENQPGNTLFEAFRDSHVSRLVESFSIPKILIPGNETIYALDPDIPEGRQKLYFSASAFMSGFRWVLDGKRIQEAKQKDIFWKPERGFHILSLQDKDGKIIDSVVSKSDREKVFLLQGTTFALESISDSMKLSTETYLLSPALEEAILLAEVTSRPLLLKGEPGTGKSLLAEYLADQRKLSLYTWHIKSITQAKEGLYFYDAVSRLNDSRFSEDSEKVKNIENYIRLGALGEAFSVDKKSIVLIDEIDKADIEFPNDLLLELDRMEFFIPEISKRIQAKHRPLTIITSNNEKELPAAFLRRCIFHYIEFPDPEFMKKIILSHYPGVGHTLLIKALEMFYLIRRMDDLKKKPGTSELLDWIQILVHQGAVLKDEVRIPFLGALIKNEEDLRLFRN